MKIVFVRDFESVAERLEGTRKIMRAIAAIAVKKAA
jgi:transcription-repair coupling factor (superfamily II helicase)